MICRRILYDGSNISVWENVVHDTSFNNFLCTSTEFWNKYLSLPIKGNVDLGGFDMVIRDNLFMDMCGVNKDIYVFVEQI